MGQSGRPTFTDVGFGGNHHRGRRSGGGGGGRRQRRVGGRIDTIVVDRDAAVSRNTHGGPWRWFEPGVIHDTQSIKGERLREFRLGISSVGNCRGLEIKK